MTTQIAVRLPDDLVDGVDHLIASGVTPSRAALVTQALRRELRRQRAIEDLDRLDGDDPELQAWQEWAAARTIPSID